MKRCSGLDIVMEKLAVEDSIQLDQSSVQWRDFVTVVMNLLVS